MEAAVMVMEKRMAAGQPDASCSHVCVFCKLIREKINPAITHQGEFCHEHQPCIINRELNGWNGRLGLSQRASDMAA
eukprot:1160717-Pelagomonas_calceolata.AAC.2